MEDKVGSKVEQRHPLVPLSVASSLPVASLGRVQSIGRSKLAVAVAA